MKSTIKLFKAVPINRKGKSENTEDILKETIKKGFIFSPEVVHNYSEQELVKLIEIVDKELCLSGEQMNSSFHKSWKKIKEASTEQLVMEQMIHYITTYGFKELGIFNDESVYIPNEKLEIPETDLDEVKLLVIKGYTKEEFKEKILSLLKSGIALGEDTLSDVMEVATFVELNEDDIAVVKNKEAKTMLYDYLNLFPENPIEFLRYVVYKATNKTLLIKSPAIINKIKESPNLSVANLFSRYKCKHGLERLAEIFHRFKPLFLAFKTNPAMSSSINRIRKLAVDNHKPMKEDFLNEVTSKIRNVSKIESKILIRELDKVNTFRKARLAYALKFRTTNANSILYRIRNGKSYAKGFSFPQKAEAKRILDIVVESIVKDVKKNVNGKKIFIPDYVKYTLPATEKQFTGNFPSGSYVSMPKDMVVGIHWENIEGRSIDLDLSLINMEVGKIGWDSNYRTEDRSVLFSGDVTNAPKPRGASELFYVKKQALSSFILMVNYYNYNKEIEVPFKIMTAMEQVKNLKLNYMVNPNSVLAVAPTSINQRQKILGLLVTTTNECRFYFAEAYLGGSITSSNSEFVDNSRNYLFNFYRNTLSLNNILEKAGANLVESKDGCDIDLSPEGLEKSKIISLIG